MQRLTKPQRLIYDMEKFYGGNISVICGSIVTKTECTAAVLTAAVNELFRLNDALRIHIVETDSGPVQEITDYTQQEVEILRFESKTELDTYADRYAKVPIDLYDSLCELIPFRLPGGCGLLAKIHHMVGDAWTLALIGSQFNALLSGETPEAYSYAEYLEREDDYLQSGRYEKDRAYFLERFQTCDEVTFLSEKRSESTAARRKTYVVAPAQARRLGEYAKRHNTSAFSLFMTTAAVYLSRVRMNAEKFYIGTAVLNRVGKREKNTAGMFVNTAPLLVELDNTKTFGENLERVKSISFDLFRHQKYNYGDLLAALRREYGFTGRLYDVMVSYQNAAITGETSGFASTWYHSGAQAESLQIHIDDRDGEDIFRIHFDYQTEKFTEAEIDAAYTHMMNLLFDAVEHEDAPIRTLEMLSPAERHKMLVEFNDTVVEYPKDKCVHQLFEEQVGKDPAKTAVVACDRTLTYQELNETANRIAHGLMEKGVCPGDIVAFALHRTSRLISAMFGILKTGAAYLPIDLDYPQERVDYMLSDSRAKLLLTDEVVAELLKNEETANPAVPLTSSSLCYCIYTSGSTGKPKGTLLTHRGIVNLTTNLNIYKDLSTCRTIGFMTTIVFDVATQEIFTTLLNGFAGVLLPERKETSANKILKVLACENVDVIYATPSYFNALTDSAEKASALLKTVKVVVLAGEAFNLNQYVMECKDSYHVIFENQYGPVELHVIATATVLQDNDFASIGKPVGNNQAYIVDKCLNPVPIGVTGELCIAGDGVGAGYLNRPELTAEKFIENPFGPGKLYKTGDLAYWREDGNIVYVGRSDFQVKVRGLRIELGEIETAIAAVEGISQAVVVVRKDDTGRQLICAFYTETKPVPAEHIKSALREKLPRYMIPHVFTLLDALPMTPSGKIDRKALPEVDLTPLQSEVEYVAPITPKETTLTNAIQAVLSAERVGLLDNFFDLGGDSLKAIELIARLEKAGFHTDIRTIFARETVKELAAALVSAALAEEEEVPTRDILATAAQLRVYTAQNMQGGTAYNVPYVFRAKSVDPERLQAAVSALIDRHEILRTHFENRDGEIMQVAESRVEFKIEQLATDDISTFIRPFDLSKAPLLRVGYFENTIMVDLHHIITDGSSMPVFLRELNELYMGRKLKDSPVQYRAFAGGQQDMTAHENYWLSVYREELPELALNTDFKRGQKQSYRGAVVYDSLDGELHKKILAKCKALNVTPYVFYLGGFYVLLSKFSGNEDIAVGTPASGREGKFLNTLGMFVNTLAVRNRPEGEKSVRDFLLEVKESSLAALEHQVYPYGNLVKKLGLQTQGRNPLFDVMFAYQSDAMTAVTFGDQPAELLPVPVTTAKYDFTFNVLPRQSDVVLMVEYCADLYKEQTIQRLIDGYKLILTQMLDEGQRLKAISAMNEAERNKLLVEFNDTAVEYPREKCVHQLFEEQAERTPDKTAVVACDCTLTYQELNESANRIAHGLIAKGIGPGDIVSFALHRTSKLIAAMFGILKAGAAYLPIDLDHPQERIDYMLSDSGAKLLLTDEMVAELLKNDETANPAVPMTSDSLCYCIYTSGSTGKPKGTLLMHRGIVNLTTNLNIYKDLSTCRTIGFMTTIVFDVATQEIFTTLINDFVGVLLPERKETSANEILKVLACENVDVIYATPSYFNALTDSAEKANALLKTVKVVVLAGEAFYLNQHVMNCKDSCHVIFVNQYGPAETHVATDNKIKSGYNDITIGKPIANTQIYMVDKYLNPVPIGVTGELCIAGDGVGAGYLNRPNLTAEKFIDNPFGPGKLYKTGDLAYWREDGNIVYMGRSDFQVKVRGLRIELGEIETAIAAVEDISQAVVVVRKDDTGRQLICAFYTETKPVPVEQIKSALREKLPRYMTPHIFTRLDVLPITPSGKIDRKSLPEVDFTALQSEVEYVAPTTPEEIALTNAIQSVLDVERVGLLDNFFDLGGDSLKAIELIAKLEKAGLRTDAKTIFACETVKELAAALEKAAPAEEEPIPDGDIPATAAQLRVYTAQNMQGGTAYNVPYVFRAKSVDPERLQAAVSALTDRHEILRTHFENRDGEIMQVAEDSVPFTLERLESGDVSAFVRPFDLSKAPLLRVGYFENTVMVDLHHIITDGGSMPVFLRELNELYMCRELKDSPVQYRVFAARKQDTTADENYWLSVYREELPELDLNTDFKRGQKQSYRGAAVYDSLDGELHKKILAKCKALNVTPYVFYLGGFYILLSKFSGNEDIAVGTPASGREGRFLNTLGMFVNTLAIRGRPEGDKSVRDFLGEVKESSLAALEHQAYPYGNLVKKLGLQAQGRNPLFDVMFAYQSEAMTAVTFGDKSAELLPVPVTTAKYDFTFNVLPRQGDVVLMAEYCADLYREQTIRRFLDGYKLILTQMLSEEQQLKALSAMTDTEKRTLLVDFNDTAVEYPREKCIHQLFEEQVEKNPDKTAVVACDQTLTYRELNEAANRIAHGLMEKGVCPGDIVAFALHRTSKLISAMFGILKTGAAYLPIDLDYPQERVDYMLSDSRAKLLLTDEMVAELLKNDETANPAVPMTSDSLCYCIYTSGSTGKPKGIVQIHRSVANFVQVNGKSTFQQALVKDSDYTISCNSISFDITLQEIHLPLLNGLSVIFCDDEQAYNIGKATCLFESKRCGLIITPTKLELYMANTAFCKSLKNCSVIMCGAEAFPPKLFETLKAYTSATIFNGYGPTETTCGVLYSEVVGGNDITLGKPIANTQIYIVDKYLNPVPIGVTGELCIAGDGVGAGYLNRPELTAEKFIPNPFGPSKLYKTGDLAYWREDGNIVYVGRSDFQVKVRGLRIELGEIEAAISAVEGISQAVVIVRKDNTGRQLICAFYTETKPVPVEQIKAALREKLPRYMTPHAFTRLDALPMTPSGKIDCKALPEVDLTNILPDTEYVRPEGKLEAHIATVMAQVLHYAPVGRENSFFDLGGDSLKAIEFISKAHSEGIYLALQSVFDHPTVAGLARVIREGDRPAVSFADVDFTEINKILAKNRLEGCTVPQETEVGNLLLAGATGFLGIHILADFLEHDSGIVYCLVRGKDQADSETRMADLLRFYFGEKYIGCDRIRVLRADLREKRFGLTEEDYGTLCGTVDTVINAAASVKHYGSYQYFKEANVDTVERLIRFCRASGAKLLHISTLSVSGNGFDTFDGYVSEEEMHFFERDLYIGQPLDNVYTRSKFEAERAVLEAMGKGLRANIFRMGNLTSRLSDGVFQKNYETNAFLKRVKAFLELGMIPDYFMSLYVEFTPIDEAASAVMTITRHFSAGQTVFHINSTKVFYMDALIEYCRKLGYPMEVVNGEKFTAALRNTMEQSGMEHIFETFINDLDANDHLAYDSRIHIETQFTEEYLRRLGFAWRDLGVEYLRKYLGYLQRIGYIKRSKKDA